MVLYGEVRAYRFNGIQRLSINECKTKYMENFVEKLKKYFEETPREKVLEDWEKTKECDNDDITVEDFLKNTNENIKKNDEKEKI